MTARLRLALLTLSGLVLAWPVWRIAVSLPAFGAPEGAYGQTINALGPPLRHVANMVSAVNFDFRGFDTVGEEFMLVCAVTGAILLLRGTRGESLAARAEILRGRAHEPHSDAVRLACRVMAPVLLVFGGYIALHGMTTPGGGFQGGVIVASGLLLVYLGDGYELWRGLVRSPVLSAVEGAGALAYVLFGAWPMLNGHAFLQNDLPLGKFKDFLSGGLMFVLNLAVAFAVAGGFGDLFLEFLEETRAAEDGDQAQGGATS